MSHSITNLEQIRAVHALQAVDELIKGKGEDGDQLSGYHSLIITNGLLAALAFSFSKGESGQHPVIADKLLEHLAQLQQAGLFPGEPLGDTKQERLITLTKGSASILIAATNECMAYLAYLKRFVRAEEKNVNP